MKTATSLLTACALASALASAREAAAQNAGDYPVRLVARPQTIPARTLRLDGEFVVNGLSACITVLGTTRCESATATGLNLGAAFGVTNELEVGATVVPLQLTESFAYRNPSLYARYQFFRNAGMQAGVELSATIPVQDGSKFGLQLGVPYWYAFSDMFQLRTGAFYALTLTDPVSHGVTVPLVFNLNFTDNVHGALRTGVNLPFQNTGDTLSIPLGVEGGFALAGDNNRPLLDLVASFSFPLFLVPGSSGDVVNTSLWQLGLAGRFYLFM